MSHGNWKDLFKAVEDNDYELVAFHIRQGVDINYQHPEFLTSPLIESIRKRHTPIMQLLLDNGALPGLPEVETNKSPLAIAKESNNQEAIDLLRHYLHSDEQVTSKLHNQMKAVICVRYGPPEVLQIHEVDQPIPNEHQILVKIMSTAVNSGDVRVRGLNVDGFMKWMMRIVLGWSKPRKPILGTVFSGVVERVGSKVTKFKEGDKVFGMTGFSFGTYAEYLTVHQNGNVLEMPANATFDEAAAIIFGGQTAIYFLEHAGIGKKSNPKVLIIGATGAVGTAAVQIARHHQADITAVCSSRGEDLIRSLGVNKIILYDREDIGSLTDRFDIIFDAVGKTTKKQCQHLLSNNGTYKSVSSGYAAESLQQLQLLKTLFENGALNAVINKTFPLEEVVAAHRYVDTGRKKGNVVLTVVK